MDIQNWQHCRLISAQPSTVNNTDQLVHLTFQYTDSSGNTGIATSDIYAVDLAHLFQQNDLLSEVPSSPSVRASSQHGQRGGMQPRLRTQAQAV